MSPVVVTRWGQTGDAGISEFAEDAGELLAEDFGAAFRPGDKMGAGHFLIHGHLRGQALPDVVGRPGAGQQPLVLGGGRTGEAEDFVEAGFGLGLEEERNDDDADGTIFLPPDFGLGEPPGADARVEDGFQFLAGGGICENKTGQGAAIQGASGSHDFGAELGLNFGQGGLAGQDELMGDFVGIDDARAEGQKKTGGGGFTHSHAAGQTDQFHFTNSITEP